MDPDETLRQLRELIRTADPIINPNRANDMIVLFEALDGWLSNGGFPPKAWTPRSES